MYGLPKITARIASATRKTDRTRKIQPNIVILSEIPFFDAIAIV
jgi:hypothetical protein